ncbi:MAG: AAA family ATPase [Bacteroidaceae bacterium]|nr:AAA family ATPase [Bacteroidaceae bacterium]
MYVPNFNWIPAVANLNDEQQENLKKMAVKGLQIAGLATAGYYGIKVASTYLNQCGKRQEQQKLQEHRYAEEMALSAHKADDEIRILEAKAKAEIEVAKAKAEISADKQEQASLPEVMQAPAPIQFENLQQAAGKASKVSFLAESWIAEGRINLLCAPTGVGKTMLAAHLGVSMASGQSFAFLKDIDPKKPVDVFYLDKEVGAEGLASRGYGDYTYPGSERFHYTNIEGKYESGMELLNSIEASVMTLDKDALFVVDHVTFYNDLLSAPGAAGFIEKADSIIKKAKQQGINITFILVVHVDLKSHNDWEPITMRDINGASNLANGSQSIVTLEKAKEDGCVLLKNLKLTDAGQPGYLVKLKIVEKPVAHFEFVEEVAAADEVLQLPDKPSKKQQDPSAPVNPVGRPSKGLKQEEFYLLFQEGKTNKEIAEISGLREETVANKRTAWKKKVENQTDEVDNNIKVNE